MLTVLLIVLLRNSLLVFGKFHCVGTCYSGRAFPKPEEVVQGKYLKGYSYRNITTDNPRKCFSSCINDCRCKACQMKGARCELLEEDKTSKADDFVPDLGYMYYDLKQEMYKGKSHMVKPGVCYNGCCRSQPCMNGGTCVEQCNTPKEKFNCTCPITFTSTVCQTKVASCMGILKNARGTATPTNGKYTIYRSDNDLPQNVYCDFTTPNQTWTLVESFKLALNGEYQKKAFFQDFTRNANSPPNWQDYRMSLNNMKYFRTKSTLFRCTCNFKNRGGVLVPDFLLGSLSDYDLINAGDAQGSGCKKYKHINIRGFEIFDKTASTYMKTNTFHFHLEPTKCELHNSNAHADEEYFGYYGPPQSDFQCTANEESTTEWWLGEELHP